MAEKKKDDEMIDLTKLKDEVVAAGKLDLISNPYRKQKNVEMEEFYSDSDNILTALRSGANAYEVLEKVAEEMFSEASNIKLERAKLVDSNKSTVNTSHKRTQILKSAADLIIQKRALAQKEIINVRGERFKAIFNYLFSRIRKSLDDCGMFTIEQKQLYLDALQRNLHGFEEEAEEIMRNIDVES